MRGRWLTLGGDAPLMLTLKDKKVLEKFDVIG